MGYDQVLFNWLYIYIFILWNQHPGTKRKKTWMKDATCRSSMRSLQKEKRMYHGPKNWEAGLLILILWPLFLGPESGPCFGATKHKQELFNTGSKCATAATSSQQHISVILRGYMPEKLALPLIWGSGFGALSPPRLWEKAPPML